MRKKIPDAHLCMPRVWGVLPCNLSVLIMFIGFCKVVSDVLYEKKPLRHDIPSEVQ